MLSLETRSRLETVSRPVFEVSVLVSRPEGSGLGLGLGLDTWGLGLGLGLDTWGLGLGWSRDRGQDQKNLLFMFLVNYRIDIKNQLPSVVNLIKNKNTNNITIVLFDFLIKFLVNIRMADIGKPPGVVNYAFRNFKIDAKKDKWSASCRFCKGMIMEIARDCCQLVTVD